MSLACEENPNNVKLGMLKLTSGILEEIIEGQKADVGLVEQFMLINQGKGGELRIDENNMMRFRDRVCVPYIPEIKKSILKKGHISGLIFIQKLKIEHQKLLGLMQPLSIPEWKWDSISMDFVTSFPKMTKGYDFVWVIVDRLTKSAHFIPNKISYPLHKLVELHIERTVSLYGIPSSIVSDRHLRLMVKQIKLSNSLEDLLRAYVLEQGGAKDNYLTLIEFTYNNSFHSSIRMDPFEVLYGTRCKTPLCWYESNESAVIGPEFVQQTSDKITMIQEKMKAS
ncbi:hypothetical protein KIW84_057721 [Lathyrus oleraceus]|uniref:Retrotransposon protein n=1 Tax=Pisum sativum TaxID=3888 RepID=A0A9D4X2Y3_PEA|nr:hypothetical protein KIW84_057721 [Pisum sativum]